MLDESSELGKGDRVVDNGTSAATGFDKFDLYKTRVDTFKFYVTHGRNLCIIYLSFVGALLKFALDAHATPVLTYVNLFAVVIFCIWTEKVRKIHLAAASNLKNSLDTLSDELGIESHVADGEQFLHFIEQLKVFNFITIGSMLVLFIVKVYDYHFAVQP